MSTQLLTLHDVIVSSDVGSLIVGAEGSHMMHFFPSKWSIDWELFFFFLKFYHPMVLIYSSDFLRVHPCIPLIHSNLYNLYMYIPQLDFI